MALRPSVRFDVFKRDGFTCSYCGRKPPEVTLEVDHIIPIVGGGTDATENLTTACWDCNRGKGAKQLDSAPPAIPDLVERTELLRERERQLRAYHEVVEQAAARQDEAVDRVLQAWCDEWGDSDYARREVPGRGGLRRYIDELGEPAVHDAIDTTGAKFKYVSANAVRYLFGVLKWKSAEAHGLVAPCAICGKRLMLEAGDDPKEEWIHTGCEQKESKNG